MDILGNIIKLRPDRFTSLEKTPWAGYEIAKRFKKNVVPSSQGLAIGESWEFSCDPSFPSIVQSLDVRLDQFVKDNSARVFGDSHSSETFCNILVKLLNADQPLSLQVHPADHDPGLKEGECGKPESWLILHAAPGSGIFLGFKQAMTTSDLRVQLLAGDTAKDSLYFVPVKKGDFFEIEPGVPHAIGPGVTLLEPQRIDQGRSGKTYRLWDWGRLYNNQGQLDLASGKPRELHLEQALKLIDPQTQVGEAFVEQRRRKAKQETYRADSVRVLSFPANPYYQCRLVSMQSEAHISVETDRYAAIILLEGKLSFLSRTGIVSLRVGESALLPVSAGKLEIIAEMNKAEFALVSPHETRVEWR